MPESSRQHRCWAKNHTRNKHQHHQKTITTQYLITTEVAQIFNKSEKHLHKFWETSCTYLFIKCFSELFVFFGSNICAKLAQIFMQVCTEIYASWHQFVQVGTDICASLHWWVRVCTYLCKLALIYASWHKYSIFGQDCTGECELALVSASLHWNRFVCRE